MIIDKNTLCDFLEKSSFKGLIDKAILDFKEGEIIAKVATAGNFKWCKCRLDIDKIKDYKPIGEIAVKDLTWLFKCAKRFKEDIKFKIEKNVLYMKETNTEFDIVLADPDYIEERPKDVDIVFPFSKTINTELLQDIIKDGELGKNPDISFETINKQLIIKVDLGLNTIKRIVQIEEEIEAKTTVQHNFLKATVCCLTSPIVTLKFGDKYPIGLVEKCGNINSLFIIAPKVEED